MKSLSEVLELIDRLRIRASIRRTAHGRKSVQEGKPDRIAELLDEAADTLDEQRKVIYGNK